MSNKSGVSSQVISLPKGGGALHGIGETFSPDLHTGTGNFTVPIALPSGRNGFQPQLNLVYSTGNSNGYFGLGWSLSIPGVSRRISNGVPGFDDTSDTFILSGAEDLVPIESQPNWTRYRPRTEGLFAQIHHYHEAQAGENYWKVRTKDGLTSYYGTPKIFREQATDNDKATLLKPGVSPLIFAWKLTRTIDPFGNWIDYSYLADSGTKGAHQWDQPLLNQIRYVNYADEEGITQFLVTVTFTYEDRTDAVSEYRAGFEICTSKRCREITIETHADRDYKVRTYRLAFEHDAINGASLLSQIDVINYSDDGESDEGKGLPPVRFGYTIFDPQAQGRKFFPITGPDLPAGSLGRPEYELADLSGDGLPDIFQMNGTVRYWGNLGSGKFDLPRQMRDAPAGLMLADPGVQMIDADGDARIDLLVTKEGLSGYFPLRFDGFWDHRSFQRYLHAPSFSLEDPEVKLVDLDGDGVTDAIRSGTRLECFFNDQHKGWTSDNTRWVERQALDVFPNVNFSDPRVKWGDMSGDGLQDIVLVYDGNVEYWPNLGYGNWGKRIHMEHSPHFPYGYDPKRILIGDVDGDGLADIVYVDDTKVMLWINQSGNGWSESAIVIEGTPPVTDMDAVRLVDMLGCGTSGVLWSTDLTVLTRAHMFFLDFTGGSKPYLLNEMDNHMGAVTKVEYAPSTRFYLDDRTNPKTRWKTSLPFPVQVVARVEVIDNISKGKLTTEYKYHHGYWDGAEREFRGFGMVEQFDTETFAKYKEPGLHSEVVEFIPMPQTHFSQPTRSKTWFHQGPVGEEFGEWRDVDWSSEYWPGDPQVLDQQDVIDTFFKGIDKRRVKRDALRTLRGSILRTELYALDGTEHESQPYTITESLYGLREESPPGADEGERLHIFFPHVLAQRTTQWERGDDPMTQFTFIGRYDEFGQSLSQTAAAMPRRKKHRIQLDANVVADETHILATHTRTVYAKPAQGSNTYIHGRVAWTTSFEHASPPVVVESKPSLVLEVIHDHKIAAQALHNEFENQLKDWQPDQHSALSIYSVFAHTVNHYDGPAYQGLAVGEIDAYGALTFSATLVLTDKILTEAYETDPLIGTDGKLVLPPGAPNGFDTNLGYRKVTAETGYVEGIYSKAKQQKYDVQDPTALTQCGLVVGQKDPRGNESSITHDAYALLPISVRDPVGLETTAEHNYRVLQPARMTEPNGNWTEIHYSPIGLPIETWIRGKNGEGDETRPSVKLEYDFLAFKNSPPEDRKPIFGTTIRYEFHDTDSDDTGISIESHEYSDGFGRLLQTRTQGEGVRFGDSVFGGGQTLLPVKQSAGVGGPITGTFNADAANPNVVVSGWQIYNNKGHVVEKYEPFFSVGWEYAQPTDAQLGQKAIMYYDPRGQVIRTVNPDGSEQRVIYGIPKALDNPPLSPLDTNKFLPTPWEAYTYDANDLAPVSFHPIDTLPNGSPKPLTDRAPRHHHFTPSNILIDGLGRTIMAVERNRAQPAAATAPLPPIEEYRTSSTYDIRGNLLTVTDALSRRAFIHVYDLTNRPVRIDSIDAGVHISVLDAAGNVIEQQDSKGALILHSYDEVNRPTHLWARDGTGQSLTLREKLVYGDDPQTVLSPTRISAGNLLGKLYQHYDEAGLLTFGTYDFKGNLLEKTRQVIADSAILTAFNSSPTWEIKAFRVNWDPISATPLDASYTTKISYDALNRIKTMQYPDDIEGIENRLIPTYNRAGALVRVNLDSANYVDHIAYNAKGQRTLIAYGNGVMTRYAYDEHTFRLVRLRTERYAKPAGTEFRYELTAPGQPLQDFAYEYDLAGNILALHDRTPDSGLPAQPNQLDRTFTYDPLYRLLTATGQECDTSAPAPAWDDSFRCDDRTQIRPYTQKYTYDRAGNMMEMRHTAEMPKRTGNGSFTRQFSLAPGSNRLTTMTIGATPSYTYTYDDSGNLTDEGLSRHYEWDYADRMRVYRTQTAGAQPSIHAHYLYDAGGERVMKFVRHQGGAYEVTVYIDGVFEHHRWDLTRPDPKQDNHLHVMDNQSRIALVRVGEVDAGDPFVQYQLGDHLGSTSVVIGGNTASASTFINREEYFPYGETSFGSFGKKRYRFTGKERDEESGLYYHGARYYAPWLTRWVSCDPMGPISSLNLFRALANNPLRFTDPTGTADAGITRASADAGSTATDNRTPEHLLVYNTENTTFTNLERVTKEPKTGSWTKTEPVKSMQEIVDVAKKDSGDHKIQTLGILVHGMQGQFDVGSDKIDALHLYEKEFKELSRYLAADAKVLLLMCNTGGGEPGTILLQKISKLLPGRDVIAFNVLITVSLINSFKEGGYLNGLIGGRVVGDPKIWSNPAGVKAEWQLFHSAYYKDPSSRTIEANEKSPQAKIARDGKIITPPSDEIPKTAGPRGGSKGAAKPVRRRVR